MLFYKQNVQTDGFRQLKSKKNLIPQRIEALNAGIDALESSLKLIERDIKDTRVKSPFTGVLMEPLINAGDYVRKGDVVCRIYDPVKVEIWIPVGVSEKEKLGSVKSITVSDIEVKEFRYLGSADKELQSDTLILNLSDSGLKAGELIKCRIEGRLLQDVYAIPLISLRDDRKSINVKVGDELQFKRDAVIALRDKSKIYISAGLSEKDEVIISRVYDAAEGTKLNVLKDSKESGPDEAVKVEKKKKTGSEK